MVAVVLGLQGGDESEQQLQNISLLHRKLTQICLCPFFGQVFHITRSSAKSLLCIWILEEAFIHSLLSTNSGCPDPPGRAQCWHNPGSIFFSVVIQESPTL